MFNKQKKYFKDKYDSIQKMIWDFEFKREKSKMIREEIRVEYDNNKSRLELLEAQIKSQAEKPTMSKDDIARLDDDKVKIEKDIERYKNQMKDIDLEIDGSQPTEELPNGQIGINHQLDSLRELLIMVKEYIKKL